MRILFLLAQQFNRMFQAKSLREQGMDNASIAQKIGLRGPYQVNQYLTQARRYSTEALYQTVEDCVNAEEDIKTGRMGDRLAVEMLIVKFSE